MADVVNTIDLLGDQAVAKALVEKTITEYNDDTIDSIGRYAFHLCYALTRVYLPNATSIGENAFYYCHALTSVDLPSATSIGLQAFHSCSALTSVDLPNVTSFDQAAFQYCSNLKVLVLRSNAVCTLYNKNAFTGTPFASGGTGGTVYVPQALITEYQNATNWSTLYAAGTCNFVAIEGSEYE